MVGDVVLTPYPFTDLSQPKTRPAVVIADAGMSDWIVCQITSRASQSVLQIEIGRGDMQTGNLRVVSYARPDRLITLNDSVFQRTVGHLTNTKLNEILTAARGLF